MLPDPSPASHGTEADRAPSLLVVDQDRLRRARLARILATQGFEVHEADLLSNAQGLSRLDGLLIQLGAAPAQALELVRAAQADRPSLAILAYGAQDAATVRAAWHLGLVDALPEEPDQEQLERQFFPALAEQALANLEDVLELDLDLCPDSAEIALRELGALAWRNALGPAARARLLGAVAELLENSRRHAYPGQPLGRIQIEANAKPQRVWVLVQDFGNGFDLQQTRRLQQHSSQHLSAFPAGRAYAVGGLLRAEALCERFELDSHPGRGTRVELEVAGYPASFDSTEQFDDPFEESLAGVGEDLSDRDYLDPGLTRRCLLAISRGELPASNTLPPALAVGLGRVLNAGARPVAAESKRSA